MLNVIYASSIIQNGLVQVLERLFYCPHRSAPWHSSTGLRANTCTKSTNTVATDNATEDKVINATSLLSALKEINVFHSKHFYTLLVYHFEHFNSI